MTVSRRRKIVRPTAQTRRASKVLCEALEERQLMSLTVELRAADGSSSATVNTVGQQITLNVVALITAGVAGANDINDSAGDPNTFGITTIKADFLSSPGNYGNMNLSGTIAGNLTATLAQPFHGPGAETGLVQDLNGDGNLDVGTNTFDSATNDEWQPQASTPVTTGTVVGSAKEIILGTVTYTVTALNNGGETDINIRPFPSKPGQYLVADWFDGVDYFGKSQAQGEYASDAVSTISAGTPFVVTDSALVVAPTAVADTTTAIRNTPDTIPVLANDIFVRPPDDTSIAITSAPTHGTATPNSQGQVIYTPATGYIGTDSFSYTVDDTDGRVSNAATVSINVTPPPPPVAGAVSTTTLRNQPDTINVLGSDTVTSPATIVPADVQVVGVPTHGTAVPQADGSILYTPNSGYTGSDSFTYTVQDTNSEVSSPGTVSISVNAPVPPTAGGVSGSTTAGAPVTLNVLSSDAAINGTLVPGSVTVVTAPTQGTAVVQSDGSILYTPAPKYVGADSFTYTVSDSLGDVSAPATVSLTIAAGTPPVAGAVTAPAISGQTNTINVLGNSSSGAPLVPSTVTIITPPTNGTATVNASDGSIAYVPTGNFVGTDTFTYTVSNVNGDTATPATVSVDVGTTIASTKGAAHSLSFTDAAGGLETITLNRGSAELFFSGNGGSVTTGKTGKAVVTGTSLALSGITLSGTVAGSVLSIRGSVKDPVTIGGITDNSPMGSIIAPNAALSGSVSLAGLGTLNVASISNASIGIGSSGPARFSLTTGAITDTTLDSTVPISVLKATSWTGESTSGTVIINGTSTPISPGGIKAPSINSLSVTGGFNPDVTLTANGRGLSLGNARINGAVTGGVWSVPGPTGTVTLGSATGWTSTFGTLNSFAVRSGGLSGSGTPAITAGAVGSLAITGDLTGSVTAASARLIRVNGNINGSSIAITGALGQLVATGSLIGDTITTGGNLTSLSAASLNGTNVSAGVVSPVAFSAETAANVGSATIGTVRLTGRTGDQFTASNIVAGRINTASIGSVTTANGGTNFGLAAKYIGTFAGVFAGGVLHLPHSALVSTTVINSYAGQQGDQFGDFEIVIEA